MTATGLPDRSVADAVEVRPGDEPTGSPVVMANPTVDGTDPETRHRLRRTLRMLLAARRRDDGGDAHSSRSNSN